MAEWKNKQGKIESVSKQIMVSLRDAYTQWLRERKMGSGQNKVLALEKDGMICLTGGSGKSVSSTREASEQ